jgi:glutamate racemase
VKPNAPIGIFDSGIGGLTVMSAIRERLPNETLVYLGDTARVPYGSKSPETVIKYAWQCSNFLVEKGVKAIVVACNTASAVALSELSRGLKIPVLGVIEPGAEAAIAKSKRRAIGVIATQATIASNAYGKALKSLDGEVRVVSRATPLFVPLVEEGWVDNEVVAAAVKRYLEGMHDEGIDVLILGCTHYPLLKNAIQNEIGVDVQLVDSAETTALALEQLLISRDIKAVEGAGLHRLYVTDLLNKFEQIAGNFLGCEPPNVTRVDL